MISSYFFHISLHWVTIYFVAFLSCNIEIYVKSVKMCSDIDMIPILKMLDNNYNYLERAPGSGRRSSRNISC